MAEISWGIPRLVFAPITLGTLSIPNTGWKLLTTPVQNSTTLETTKGDKKEAKVEGGANEAVRYEKSTYALSLQIRAAVGRKKPFGDKDGVIAGTYAVALQPENAAAPGLYIGEATVSVETTYSAEDGLMYTYTFDALENTQSINGKKLDQLTEATVTITEGESGITVTVVPLENEEGFDDSSEV